MSIILNIENDGHREKLIVTQQESIIGRSAKANVTINDERMSGQHCSIKLSNTGKILIKDLDSTNGTFLGASQIDEGQIMIGDMVRAGNTIISVIESKLTSKEKMALKKKNDPTQVRYLDLKNSEESTQHAVKIRKMVIREFEEDEHEKNENAENTKQKIKNNILNKAKQLKASAHNKKSLYESENTLERQPETGNTGLIQIDKIVKKSDPQKQYRPKQKDDNKKKELHPFLKKIISLFKKDKD